jgi:hypothetical protein
VVNTRSTWNLSTHILCFWSRTFNAFPSSAVRSKVYQPRTTNPFRSIVGICGYVARHISTIIHPRPTQSATQHCVFIRYAQQQLYSSTLVCLQPLLGFVGTLLGILAPLFIHVPPSQPHSIVYSFGMHSNSCIHPRLCAFSH